MNFCFDMDGTIADLYSVENWLPRLRDNDPSPYLEAAPMLNFRTLARLLNAVQRAGHTLTIISWTSKGGTRRYNEEVATAKKQWLENHLPSVHWDCVYICTYGTPKGMYKRSVSDILFDDNEEVREAWGENSFGPDMIEEILKLFK